MKNNSFVFYSDISESSVIKNITLIKDDEIPLEKKEPYSNFIMLIKNRRELNKLEKVENPVIQKNNNLTFQSFLYKDKEGIKYLLKRYSHDYGKYYSGINDDTIYNFVSFCYKDYYLMSFYNFEDNTYKLVEFNLINLINQKKIVVEILIQCTEFLANIDLFQTSDILKNFYCLFHGIIKLINSRSKLNFVNYDIRDSYIAINMPDIKKLKFNLFNLGPSEEIEFTKEFNNKIVSESYKDIYLSPEEFNKIIFAKESLMNSNLRDFDLKKQVYAFGILMLKVLNFFKENSKEIDCDTFNMKYKRTEQDYLNLIKIVENYFKNLLQTYSTLAVYLKIIYNSINYDASKRPSLFDIEIFLLLNKNEKYSVSFVDVFKPIVYEKEFKGFQNLVHNEELKENIISNQVLSDSYNFYSSSDSENSTLNSNDL